MLEFILAISPILVLYVRKHSPKKQMLQDT